MTTTLDIQRRLLALGYNPGKLDGIFGDDTATALIQFQTAMHLEPNGKAEPETLEALFASAAPAVANSKDMPPWIKTALAEIGQHEIAGSRDNPRIIEYLATVGLGTGSMAHDETAWCAAFVNWSLKQNGIKGTGNAMALSFAKYGVPLSSPAFGAIGFKKRFNTEGDLIGGHVFYVVGWDANFIWALGGNQNDQVSVAKIPRSSVTGYRWIPGYPIPAMPLALAWNGVFARSGSEA